MLDILSGAQAKWVRPLAFIEMDYHLVVILNFWFFNLFLTICDGFLDFRINFVQYGLGAIECPRPEKSLRLDLAIRCFKAFFIIGFFLNLLLGCFGLGSVILEQLSDKLALCVLHQLSFMLLAF